MRRAGGSVWAGAAIDALIERLRASYWAVPAALTTLALVAGLLSVAVDHALGETAIATFPFADGMDAAGASNLMGLVAQSIFGVTGVMFSMTIVAVSFATGKFGPRLISNFMRDRVNQWSLGVLTASFVFALVVARSIREGEGGAAFVPQLSILIALLLMLACVGIVIYFVHHVPEMINISRLTAAIGRRLMSGVRKVAEAQAHAAATDGAHDRWFETDPDDSLALGRSGYIEALDLERLRALAEEADLRIAVESPVGSFVSDATTALHLWGRTPDAGMRDRLLDCFVLGDGPTADHNLLHLVDQLVEITARALSPGVNDPFTAINCVNWLYAAALVGAVHGDGLTGAQEGRVRLQALRLQDLLDRGFGASRFYTKTDPLCDAQVRAVLDRLLREVGPGAHRDTIRRFAATLDGEAASPQPSSV